MIIDDHNKPFPIWHNIYLEDEDPPDSPVCGGCPLAELPCEAVCVVEADLDAVAVDAALAQRARRVPLAPRQAEVPHAAVAPRTGVFCKRTYVLIAKTMAQHPIERNMQVKHQVPIPHSRKGLSVLVENAIKTLNTC